MRYKALVPIQTQHRCIRIEQGELVRISHIDMTEGGRTDVWVTLEVSNCMTFVPMELFGFILQEVEYFHE